MAGARDGVLESVQMDPGLVGSLLHRLRKRDDRECCPASQGAEPSLAVEEILDTEGLREALAPLCVGVDLDRLAQDHRHEARSRPARPRVHRDEQGFGQFPRAFPFRVARRHEGALVGADLQGGWRRTPSVASAFFGAVGRGLLKGLVLEGVPDTIQELGEAEMMDGKVDRAFDDDPGDRVPE